MNQGRVSRSRAVVLESRRGVGKTARRIMISWDGKGEQTGIRGGLSVRGAPDHVLLQLLVLGDSETTVSATDECMLLKLAYSSILIFLSTSEVFILQRTRHGQQAGYLWDYRHSDLFSR
jgi:hypothetical protein